MARVDRQLVQIVATAALVALALAWVFFLRPQALGGPAAYVIVSGKSMEPTLKNGDLVVALERSTYRVGDVVAYRVPKGERGAGALVIHRITGGSASEGYVLRGDNRQGDDLWRPKPGDIAGDMRIRLPRVGLLFAFVRTPLGMAAFAGFAAFFLLATRSGGRPVTPYPRDVYSLDVRFPTISHGSPRR